MNIIACRPVSPTGVLKQLFDSEPNPGPYTGSVKGTCDKCCCDVWIGPRQQTFIASLRGEGNSCAVWCMNCVATPVAGDFQVRSLGNPEKNEK